MTTAFINANVLDGTRQMAVIPNATILVEQGRILSVQEGGSPPKSAKIINLAGRYLMPGLINLHCHLAGSGKPQTIDASTAELIQSQLNTRPGRFLMKRMCGASARAELLSGTTTIRTVGGLGNIDAILRDEIAAGKRTGPRIVAANEAISVPKGHMAGTLAYISHNKEECVSLVHKITVGKPDLIKLMVTGGTLDIEKLGDEGKVLMPPEQIRAACEEAHRLGYPVAAHIQSSEGIRAALEGGVDTIEHGADLDSQLIALFQKKKASLVSTISTVAVMACLPKEASGLSDLYRDSCRLYLDAIISGFRKAVKADLPIGMGLDNGSPYITHYCMWRELDFFCRYIGVSPEFALHTATLKNAQILGLDQETGSIQAQKSADFLITDGNPLEDFSHMRHPYMVVKQGKMYKKPMFKQYPAYDAMLDSVSQYDQQYRAKERIN